MAEKSCAPPEKFTPEQWLSDMLVSEPQDLIGQALVSWLKMRRLDVSFLKDYWAKAETLTLRGYDQTLEEDVTQIAEW